MTTKTKTKPKCVKGTACGFTCISGKNQCSDKIKARDAAALLKATNVQPKADDKSALPKPFDNEDATHNAKIDLDIPPDKASVTFGISYFATAANAVGVTIEVNGSVDAKTSQASDGNGVKIAIAAMRAVKKHVATMPEGTLLSNTPYTGDGKGADRVKLYEKAGFKNSGDVFGNMYAVVKDGKITPVDIDYVKSNYDYYDDSGFM